MGMTRAERSLAQASVFQTRAIQEALAAVALAACGEEVSVAEVQRQLSTSNGNVSRMDEAVDQALQFDEEDSGPISERVGRRSRGRQRHSPRPSARKSGGSQTHD